MTTLLAILFCFVLLLSGCSNTAVKTPAVNQADITPARDPAGASSSVPSPPLPPQAVTSQVKRVVNPPPPGTPMGTPQSDMSAMELSWTEASAGCSFEVWATTNLAMPFALFASMTNDFLDVTNNWSNQFFKVRAVRNGVASAWGNTGIK